MTPQSRKPRFTPFSSRGASFIEILVAVSIILVASLAAGSFFSQQISTTRNLTKLSACKTALDSQITSVRQMTSSATAYNWKGKSSDSNEKNIAVDTNGLSEPWIQPALRNAATSSTDVVSGNTGIRELNTHQLQRGSMGFLAALYNNVPDICNGVPINSLAANGLDLPTPVDAELLKNFQTKIQIRPFDLGTGDEISSCAPTWARPQGVQDAALTAEKIGKFPDNTTTRDGYRLKLIGTFTDASGATKSCDSSEDFSYPVDRQAQKLAVVLNLFDATEDINAIGPVTGPAPAMNSPTAIRQECSHVGSAIDAASLRLEVGFKSTVGVASKIDPGTIFLCKDISIQHNANFCPGADGAKMNGNNWDAANAPWVPCNEVTACGLPPISSKYTKTADVLKYSLSYSNKNRAFGSDGLWGCEIKMDVATVDAAGNFNKLSDPAGTLANATTLKKYFQPVPVCYACYKKKPFSFLTLALVIGAGALTGGIGSLVAGAGVLAGGAIACATGAGGACTVKGARFMYNRCFAQHGPSGKKFCVKRLPKYPSWYSPTAYATKTPVYCPAVTTPYPQPNGDLSYSFEETISDGLGDDFKIDPETGRYCEATAVCNNGTWKAVTDPEESVAIQKATPIANCGQYYTMKKLAHNGDPETSLCVIPVPSTFGSIIGRNYYDGFTNVCNGTEKCHIASNGNQTFPREALDTTVVNHGPNYRFLETYNKNTDADLPSCQESDI